MTPVPETFDDLWAQCQRRSADIVRLQRLVVAVTVERDALRREVVRLGGSGEVETLPYSPGAITTVPVADLERAGSLVEQLLSGCAGHDNATGDDRGCAALMEMRRLLSRMKGC